MILSTTNSIESYKIIDYLGIVTGVAMNEKKLAMGFSMAKYFKAVGESIDVVKEEAFQKLKANAKQLNANAVVGINVDIELTSHNYAMVSITGTAVKVAV